MGSAPTKVLNGPKTSTDVPQLDPGARVWAPGATPPTQTTSRSNSQGNRKEGSQQLVPVQVTASTSTALPPAGALPAAANIRRLWCRYRPLSTSVSYTHLRAHETD